MIELKTNPKYVQSACYGAFKMREMREEGICLKRGVNYQQHM